MLAIVIPYYKRTFFEATLQSLANQTNKQFRVYIGNDASPENPDVLLEIYKNKFDFEYHKFEKNLGSKSLVQQWNRCIDLTKNENWIMILGDDDVLQENVFAAFYENLNEINANKINVVRFATKIINEKTGTISNSFTHPKFETATDSWFRKFNRETRSSLSEHIFSRKSYSKFGFIEFPLAWHSDDYAWLDFCDNNPIYSINESNVLIRFSEDSISGKIDNEEIKKATTILFFKKIIAQKFHFFDKKQRLELLYGYEVVIKKARRLSEEEWFFLAKLYMQNFRILPFIKLIRRFFIAKFDL